VVISLLWLLLTPVFGVNIPSHKEEVLQFKSACGRYVSKRLKEYSAVVVKKEFWLR